MSGAVDFLSAIDMSSTLGTVQDFGLVFGGIGALIWLVWRLFWNVDRRSQQEIAAKEADITRLKASVETERTQRFAAQDREAALSAEVSGLRRNVEDLTSTVQKLQTKIEQLTRQLEGGLNALPSS